MGPRHRHARASVLGGAVLMVAAGCAAGTTETALDRATGAVLADGADRLAEALEADDTCRALQEAEALRERAARAHETGDAPDDVVAETVRVVDATTFALTCEVETARAEAEDAGEADATDQAEGSDGSDEADASTSQDPAPAPAPPPADEADEPEPEGGGGSSGPARGQGPDGDGPPGHRNGRGRG